MKICFLTHNIFTMGGIQRVVSVLSNELSGDYDIDVLCIGKNVSVDREIYSLKKDIKVKKIDYLYEKSLISKIISKIGIFLNNRCGFLNKKYMNNIAKDIYFPKKIRNNFITYLNNQNYDVIVAVEGIYSLLLAIISNELNAKTIGWQHNSYDAYFNTYKKYCWNLNELFKENITKLDKYIVLTDYDKKLFEKHMKLSNVLRIYNPLSFESNEKSECISKNILFVGRLVEQQKGIDLLIKAFKIVAKQNKDWTLTIVGDGPDKQKIINLIKQYNLEDRVILKPFTNDVQKYYLESSLFVSTSRWEGFGLVITEAMECGLPVIAFDNSGPREIINESGMNGILIPCNNIELLAKEILNLIDNKNRLINISKNSIIRANDFNKINIRNQWKRLFN